MTFAWRSPTLRMRLTAAFAFVFGVSLLAYSVGVYLLVRDRLAAEVDRRLDQEVELAERSLGTDPDGRIVWRHDHHDEPDAADPTRLPIWFELRRPNGALVLERREGGGETAKPASEPFDPSSEGYRSLGLPGLGHLRVLQRSMRFADQDLILRVAMRTDDVARGLDLVFWVMLAGLPVTLVLAGAAGHWLAGRGLAPIRRMVAEAENIDADRLNTRLPVSDPRDEPGRLAVAFNGVLARLEAAFAQSRRFTADAAHELRTPLTVIRSVGEIGLREPHDEAEYRDIVGTMLEEVDRLTLLTSTLLDLTRAEGGRAVLASEPFDLRDLVRDATALLGVLAEERGLRIEVNTPDTPLQAVGDWTMLRQALINLVDNAVKHAPPGTVVSVACSGSSTGPVIAVTDRGGGIALEHLPHIFDRFYRIDADRNRKSGGFGLGLAIARWAIEAHGGSIEVESRPGDGCTFRIRLPVTSLATIHPRGGP